MSDDTASNEQPNERPNERPNEQLGETPDDPSARRRDPAESDAGASATDNADTQAASDAADQAMLEALQAAQAAVEMAKDDGASDAGGGSDSRGAAAAAPDPMAEAMADSAGGRSPVSDEPPVEPLNLPALNTTDRQPIPEEIELLGDVELDVKIELGRTLMYVEDVLKLGEGAVVELDKLAGDPVDIYVNERLVARGEVLVLNDNFCVRISEVLRGAGEQPQQRRA